MEKRIQKNRKHTKIYRFLRYFGFNFHVCRGLRFVLVYLLSCHRETPTDKNCGLYVSFAFARALSTHVEHKTHRITRCLSIAVFQFQWSAYEQRDGVLRSVAYVENQFQFCRHHTHWTYTLHIKEMFNYFKLCILFVFLMTYEIISLVVIFGICVFESFATKNGFLYGFPGLLVAIMAAPLHRKCGLYAYECEDESETLVVCLACRTA